MTRRAFGIVTLVALAATLAAPAFAAQSDKPRIAVLAFENKADNQWWYSRGGTAAQDKFVTELVKSGKFRVIDREQLEAIMREKNLTLSGDIDAKTAMKIGKLMGVQYFLAGAVTEYGAQETGAHAGGLFSGGKKTFVAALTARIIDAQTGEIIWADEARKEDSNFKLSIMGVGGGVQNDDRMFDKVLAPCIQELAASIKAADL